MSVRDDFDPDLCGQNWFKLRTFAARSPWILSFLAGHFRIKKCELPRLRRFATGIYFNGVLYFSPRRGPAVNHHKSLTQRLKRYHDIPFVLPSEDAIEVQSVQSVVGLHFHGAWKCAWSSLSPWQERPRHWNVAGACYLSSFGE